jgi:hypothetical protein
MKINICGTIHSPMRKTLIFPVFSSIQKEKKKKERKKKEI